MAGKLEVQIAYQWR